MAWLTPDEHTLQIEQAREIVLRRLDRSDAPRAVLAELLARKEADPDIAREVLDRLEQVGLINDLAYATRLARTRFNEKGAARRAVAEELRRKGLSGQVIAQALEEISDDDEARAALALARKKLAATAGMEEAVRRRRTLAHLGRKGYPAGVCLRAYEQALSESQD